MTTKGRRAASSGTQTIHARTARCAVRGVAESFMLLAGLHALGGCTSVQPLLEPRGPVAGAIAQLGWWAMGVAAVVSALVFVILLVPVLRAWRTSGEPTPLSLPVKELTFALAGGAVMPAIVLGAFYLYNLGTLSTVTRPPSEPALTVEVIGHQWWWEVRYPNDDPRRIVETANEIHVPAGQPVRFMVRTADVIHSFWIPPLGRKIDLIPGRVNSIWLQADAPGVYHGQCAEFCGAQHAKMRLLVVAEPPERFTAWYDRQLEPAPTPSDSTLLAGRRVFLASPCVFCHSVRGTPAGGEVGPDLTHVGSRRTIAAGTLRNTQGNLEAWIVDAQHLKPGNKMPSYNLFDGERLRVLAAYLHSLK